MWPSPARNNKNGISSSISKSSSSCSSPSSPGTPNKKSMEEVWQDISLTSLQDHANTAIPNTTGIPNTSAALIFQDFFARPFNKDPPITKASAAAHPSTAEPSNSSCFGNLAPHHGGALLSLNSGSGFNYLENVPAPLAHHHQRPSHQLLQGFPLNNCNSPFDDALAPAHVVSSICFKRPQEHEGHLTDRRHKRMMKNRESAARSRAYTTELEQEVAHLEKENAKLRRQLEQLLAASGQLTKKPSLYRTSSAPF
ncbi:protein FD [Citrus sinensis]|nr:protein FD [Citrus sinensis]